MRWKKSRDRDVASSATPPNTASSHYRRLFRTQVVIITVDDGMNFQIAYIFICPAPVKESQQQIHSPKILPKDKPNSSFIMLRTASRSIVSSRVPFISIRTMADSRSAAQKAHEAAQEAGQKKETNPSVVYLYPYTEILQTDNILESKRLLFRRRYRKTIQPYA